MEPDDPMMPLVTAFAQSIRFMAERGSMSDRVVTSASERIQAALVEARRTADAEAERFSGAILATETDIIRRIAGSIAASADKALTRRVKVFDRNTALWAAAALFGTAIACGVGGYVWGGNVARADIYETEAGLRAAFSHSSADANNWMLLMNWNDLSQALKSCGNANQAILDHGRHACAGPRFGLNDRRQRNWSRNGEGQGVGKVRANYAIPSRLASALGTAGADGCSTKPCPSTSTCASG